MKLGEKIERRPWTTVVLTLLITCFFIPGIPLQNWTNDPTYLWVPKKTTFNSHFDYDVSNFGTKRNRDVTVILRSSGGNVMTVDGQRDVLEVHKSITESVSGVYLDRMKPVLTEPVGYKDVCRKTGGECWDPNYLSTYDYNSSLIPDNEPEIIGKVDQWLSSGTPPEAVFGGILWKDDVMISCESVRMKYTLRSGSLTPYNDDDASYFEKAFEEYFLPPSFPPPNVAVQAEVMTGLMVDEQVERIFEDDFKLLPVAMACVVVWLAISLGGFNVLEFKGLLCLSVIIEVISCVVFAFGMMGFMGNKGTSLNFAMPFIVAGVSVDDVIVVQEFYYKTKDRKEGRMAECMALAGPAITTTSVTSVVAFFSSSYLDMPGVRSFSIACSLAFFWDMILNVTLFPALVVLDERRIEKRGAWFFPCWHLPESYNNETEVEFETRKGFENFKPVSDRNLSGGRLSDDSSFRSLATAESSSSRISQRGFNHKEEYLKMMAMKKVLKSTKTGLRSDSSGSSTSKALTKAKLNAHKIWWSVENLLVSYYAPFLQLECVQCFVLVLFTMMAVAGGSISLYTAKGLRPDEFMMKGSKVWSFISHNERLYPSDYSLLSITVTDLDYTKREEVTKMFDFFSYVEKYDGTDGVVGGAGGSWYQHYAMFLNAKGKDVYIEFPNYLDDFLTGSQGLKFEHDILCDKEAESEEDEEDSGGCTAIRASKYYIWMVGKEGDEEYRDYLHLNSKAREMGLSETSFVFKPSYLHSATTETMPAYMLNSLFLTIMILFVAMLLFTDTVSCVFITLMVIFVDCDLLGVMYLLDINISPVSFVCLIMSSGLSIDYCVHIGHAFSHCSGVNPNVRMGEAVKMMGTSVLKGGATTFLGAIPLAFASSSAFVTFFKMMFFTVFFGVIHGLVALPVFLATYYNLLGGHANKQSGHHGHEEEEEGEGEGEERGWRKKNLGSALAKGARTKKEVDKAKKVKEKTRLHEFFKSASSSVFFGVNPMRNGKGERMKKAGEKENGGL